MTETAEFRGAAFRTLLDAVSKLRGATAMERVLAHTSPDLAERIRLGAITRVGWYPGSDYDELHQGIHRALAGGQTFAERLGEVTTELDLKGMMGWIVSLTSPGLLMRHADRIFGAYVRGAVHRVDWQGPTALRLTMEGFPGISELVHCEFAGGTRFLLQHAGAHAVVVRRTELNTKSGQVRFEIRWAE